MPTHAVPPAFFDPGFAARIAARYYAACPHAQAAFERMNDQQVRAASLVSGCAAISGVPGAGKTGTLVNTLARLVLDGHTDGHDVLAMTFTKAAATEMNDRLETMLGPAARRMRVGTIHSVARQIMHDLWPNDAIPSLDDKGRLPMELKKAIGDLRKEKRIPQRGVDRERVERAVGLAKAYGVGIVHGDIFGLNALLESGLRAVCYDRAPECGMTGKALLELYENYEKRRALAFVHDFDDMLLWAYHALLAAPSNDRAKWQSKWRWIIVDEVQDSNVVQWDLARLLAGLPSICVSDEASRPPLSKWSSGGHIIAPCNPKMVPLMQPRSGWPSTLWAFGDAAQCQPAGTKVLVPGGAEVPIESLADGDAVVGWRRHEKTLTGLRKDTNTVKVASRHYVGPMLTLTTSTGESTRCTPEHKWTVKTVRDPELWCTYLMRKEIDGCVRWRAGWCQMFNKEGTDHFKQRVRLEAADAAWVLAVYKSKAEASLQEKLVSSRFNIPLVLFSPKANNTLMTQDWLKRFWHDVGPQDHAEACLAYYGRDPRLPYYVPPASGGRQNRTTVCEVAACNLIPEVMQVPVPRLRAKGTARYSPEWTPFTLRSQHFEGSVYSLDVDPCGHYVADGIVTHNSIYRFRGAEPDMFVAWATDPNTTFVPLTVNYRSTRAICQIATGLIRDKEWNLAGAMEAGGPLADEEGLVRLELYDTPEQEGAAVMEWVKEYVGDDETRLLDIAVASRTSLALDLVELSCLRERIPYRKLSGRSFLESGDIAGLLAYLHVAAQLDPDGRHVRKAINKPFRMIGSHYLNDCEGEARHSGKHLLDVLQQRSDRLSTRQRNAIQRFIDLIVELNQLAIVGEEQALNGGEKRYGGPAAMLSEVLGRTDYVEELRREEGLGEDDSRLAAIDELQRMASQFMSTREFLSYIDTVKEALRAAARQGLRRPVAKKDGTKDPRPALTLTTIHSAKGLEFEAVRVVDVSPGRLPHEKNNDTDEELRLFYVAVSRAKSICIVSGPSDSCPEVDDADVQDIDDLPLKARDVGLYALTFSKLASRA
jgi:DNA helicase-2/ATP-dependent DNA helicase PcrA